MHTRSITPALVVVALLALVAGCGHAEQGSNPDPAQVDSVAPPANGACRLLTPEDVTLPANATVTVPCTEEHTAQTFKVGTLPDSVRDASYDDRRLGEYAFGACSTAFQRYVGADESLVLRTILSWAWFRPSEKAWEEGARWFRCDVIGGNESSAEYVPLPESAKGLLATRDDAWMVCAQGPTVADSDKVPCTESHSWRAVTTIKVGEPTDVWPGEQAVKELTRDYCSESVGAWLNYPASYDYGFTWFQEKEWTAGNRRSVCWAATDQ